MISVDLDLSGDHVVVPVTGYFRAAFQVVPVDYDASTGTIDVLGSMTGQLEHAGELPVGPKQLAAGSRDMQEFSTRGVGHLHFVTNTADAGKRCRILIRFTTSPNDLES